ncbi:hypothetical protein ACWIG4_27130 [Streptomyces sp. NPDC002248]
MTTPTTEIRYCEHAARVIRIEAPAVTELLAALAHLKKARTPHPGDTTAHYAHRGLEHRVPAWIREKAELLRAELDALTARYEPAGGHLTQAPATLTVWTDPATSRTWDLNAAYLPTDPAHQQPHTVWAYRGLTTPEGTPILHPHHRADRTPAPGPCWPLTALPLHTAPKDTA